MKILDRVVLLWLCEIPCNSLGCLLGKDLLESLGAVLDFYNKKICWQHLGSQWTSLSKLKAGHFSLNLLPHNLSKWPSLSSQRWHVIGIGGVCELQCEGKMSWKCQRLAGGRMPEDSSGDLNMVVCYSRTSQETFELKVMFRAPSEPSVAATRWLRLWTRLIYRQQRHWKGVLLWLVQRPFLRFTPFPLPMNSTAKEWKQQLHEMVQRRVWPRRWLQRALGKMSDIVLREAQVLRSRVGIQNGFHGGRDPHLRFEGYEVWWKQLTGLSQSWMAGRKSSLSS